MRSAVLKHAIELSQKKAGPISKIAANAYEAGIIVPSILKAGLEKAGYKVTFHEKPGENAPEGDAKIGAWVLVQKGGEIHARAYSHDRQDALLQAVYAAMREENARVVVDAELKKREFEVTPELRQALESRFIVKCGTDHEAGMRQLTADLDAFPVTGGTSPSA